MKIIREVRNVLDGKHTVREEEKSAEKTPQVAGGFRETESRIVKKLMDLGLAVPQQSKKKA